MGSGISGWLRKSGSTPSSNTGPSSAQSGSYYYYLETSSNAGTSPGDVAILSYTGCQSGAVAAQLTFRYHMCGATTGQLRVKDASNNTVWTKSGAQGDSWLSASVLVPTPDKIRNEKKDGVGTSRRLSAGRCAGSRRRGYARSSFFVCTTHGAHPLSRHVILARSGPL